MCLCVCACQREREIERVGCREDLDGVRENVSRERGHRHHRDHLICRGTSLMRKRHPTDGGLRLSAQAPQIFDPLTSFLQPFNLPVSTVELFPLRSSGQPPNSMTTALRRGVWELVLVSPAADTSAILKFTTRFLQYYHSRTGCVVSFSARQFYFKSVYITSLGRRRCTGCVGAGAGLACRRARACAPLQYLFFFFFITLEPRVE